MQASLINHVLFSLRSAARYIALPVEELRHQFYNNPPAWISEKQLNAIAVSKLYAGDHDSGWFNSPAASQDRILSITLKDLADVILFLLDEPIEYEQLESFLRFHLPHENIVLGDCIDTLKLFYKEYPHTIKVFYVFIESLSKLDMFNLKEPV